MKHHILAIGLSKHQYPFINNLSYAAKDATEFFELFTGNVGEIGYKKLLVDSEATLTQIRTALGSELQQEVKEEDALFFFYSGHGATSENNDNKSLAHFLLPFDATQDITSSSISVSYLREVFDKLPCKIKLAFIDSCFSGAINNSKGYSKPQIKALKELKTFSNTVTGVGSLVFSASKEDETAIEDPENENGLFTHFLLAEMQKEREGEQFAMLDTFTPIAQQVTERAKKKYNHTQTPTLNSHLEGILYLPPFRKRIKVSPQTIEVPKHPELAIASFPIPELQLGDKKQEKLLNDMIRLVVRGRKEESDIEGIIFERFCGKLIKQLKEDWGRIFQEHDGNVSLIPEAVAKLEGAAFQLITLGGVVAVFGSEKQIRMYAENIVTILEWQKGQAGLIALIAAPEIIVAEIVSSVGVISVARNNLKPLSILMSTKVDDLRDRDNPPYPLSHYTYIFYCDAFGGYSDKVNDHIRETLKSYSWLSELVPRVEGKIHDIQLQTNFLLVMLTERKGDQLWHDFGRWDAYRVMPLVKKIKYDADFRKQLAAFLGVEETEIRTIIMGLFKKVRERGMGSHCWWSSIEVRDLLTEEERKAQEQK